MKRKALTVMLLCASCASLAGCETVGRVLSDESGCEVVYTDTLVDTTETLRQILQNNKVLSGIN